MPGPLRKSFIDDDGPEIRIEHGRAERVLETADKDRLIDEGIGRTAQLAPFRTKTGPARGGKPGDNQGLEIRPAGGSVAKPRRQQVGRFGFGIRMHVPITGMLAE